METINLVPITSTDVLLAGCERETFIMDEGHPDEWVVTTVTVPIIEGITLLVTNEETGSLSIGGQIIEFMWSTEMAEMFLSIDTVEPIELFEAMHRHKSA